MMRGERDELGRVKGGADGRPVDPSGDGADAAVVVICSADGREELERVPRNEAGGFYRIFQPNKWRLKKEKEAAVKKEKEKEREAALAVNVAAR